MHPPPTPHPWWMLPYRGGEDLPSCPGIRLRRCRRGETWLLKEGKKKRDFERSVDTLQASPTLEVTPARLLSTTSQLWAAVSPATSWCCSTSDDVWSQLHGYDAATLLRPLQALTCTWGHRRWCHKGAVLMSHQLLEAAVSVTVCQLLRGRKWWLLSSEFCYRSVMWRSVILFIYFFFLVETL